MAGLFSALTQDVSDDGAHEDATSVNADDGVDIDASAGVAYSYTDSEGGTHEGSTEVGVQDQASVTAAADQAFSTETA